MGDLLTGKGIYRAGKGKGVLRAGYGIIIVKWVFNTAPPFDKLWNTKVL